MFGSEQSVRNHTVGIAGHSRIKCAESQRQSSTPLGRQRMKWWTGRPAIERAPKPARRMGSHLEIIIERQLSDVIRSRRRQAFEPNTVLGFVQA